MKIFICCSKYFYDKVTSIKIELEKEGHEITLPNSFDKPFMEEEIKILGKEQHAKWKSDQLRLQEDKIKYNDAILVLNFEKNGQANYIGGATFLEMFKAWELKKEIYLFNPVPENILKDGAWIDAKSLFQEKAQELVGPTPSYKTVRESGPDHDKHFVVAVYIGDEKYGEGEGKSKQDAEQEAARNALQSKGWK